MRRGGNLDLTVTQATPHIARNRNPSMRIVQGNPICRKRWFIMMGRQTPPRDEPAFMMPNAAARLLKNHVATDDMVALNIAPEAAAATIDCERKNW